MGLTLHQMAKLFGMHHQTLRYQVIRHNLISLKAYKKYTKEETLKVAAHVGIVISEATLWRLFTPKVV